MGKSTHYLRIALLNVRSLNTGRDEFVASIDRYQPDILALNETWLQTGEDKFSPSVPGFILKSNPRANGKRGGGVGFYVRKDLQVRIKQHPLSQLEQMWMELRIPGKPEAPRYRYGIQTRSDIS